ncbi:uncharacterized protein N7496_007032 [Penicillium cataractarum]|uniref:Uncharacterized protein n=1 Tax=Penicillium cataractarum TaxID=2100454 RepID=A0A9W9S2Y5_9EURO|nr:uncharacterized protein N7496_007032 [Penicillium cataractarum]KAJ5370940.1 hypothetical protein N7496_007032 [Penicillium cataractarum]
MPASESVTSSTEEFHFDFDWAEDVEDELRRQESHGWDLCHDAKGYSSGEILEATGNSFHDIDFERDVEYITEDDIVDHDTNIVSIPLTEEVSPTQRLRRGVVQEFRGRDSAVSHDEKIHHFNWLGNPVYQPSSTTPAESLAIIFSGPKVPKENDKLRVASILRRAYQYLDPVVVSFERIKKRFFKHRGFSLQNAAEGHVFKFYTPHGQWMVDSHVLDSELILRDAGTQDVYLSSKFSIGNGFKSSSLIPTRSTWSSTQRKILRSRQRSSPRKNNWSPPPPSPLQQNSLLFYPKQSQRIHAKPL